MSVRVQSEDFEIGAEVARLTAGRTDIGAIVTFTGTVRADNDGGTVAGMTLEHYPGMTEQELARVEAERRTRWPLQASLIVHRVGTLKPGDNIVLVVTAIGASRGRVRRRGVPDGLPQDPRAVLEEGSGAGRPATLGRSARQ